MLQNFPVETVVGSYLLAAVSMKASNGIDLYLIILLVFLILLIADMHFLLFHLLIPGVYFSTCDAFHSLIKWKTSSESFIINSATDGVYPFNQLQSMQPSQLVYGPPCSWTRIHASGSGQATLHATFSKDLYFDYAPSRIVVLKAASRIAAYKPLTVHQAGDGSQFGGYSIDLSKAEAENQLETLSSLYLVPGTHLDVMIHGGPERWDESVDFLDSVETLKEGNSVDKGVQMYPISSDSKNLYKVSCKRLGTYVSIY